MGSSYAAGRPFHIIADARAAFERLMKGLTEGALEQRLKPNSHNTCPGNPALGLSLSCRQKRVPCGAYATSRQRKETWCEIKWPIHSFQTQLYEPNISFDPRDPLTVSNYSSFFRDFRGHQVQPSHCG